MALQRTPNDVALRWKLADTYQKLGAVEHAQEHLKYIAKLQPKQPEAPLALANTYLATQQWNKAEQIYRSLTRQVPRNSKGWEGLALTLYHQKKYFEAMEPARRSVRLHNIEPNHHFVLAHICLEYALQDASPASRHTYLKDAIKHFNSVLMTWPDHGDVYYYMGRAYSGLNNYKEAIKSLRRARELLPHHVPSGILLAYQYQRSTRLEEARALVEQLLAQSPRLSTSQASELHGLLGQLLQESSEPGAPQRAVDEFRRAVDLSPNNALLHQQFGMACLQAGKTDLAQQAFTEAIRLNPNTPAPYQQLSSIYSRRGDKVMAAEMARLADGMLFNEQQQHRIERLSQENPKNVSLHLILAERYQTLGLVTMARSQYLLALRYDPRNARAKTGLQYLARQPDQQARVTN